MNIGASRALAEEGSGVPHHARRLVGQAAALIYGGLRVALSEARALLRFDLPLLVLVAIYLIAFVPIIPRATENAQLLTCCINDEAYLTMALDGMRFAPFGDPHNFLMAPSNGVAVPDYWGHIRYGMFFYYGGAFLNPAFLVYWPLTLLGAPAFPTAPIILRILSLAMGLLSLIFSYNFARQHVGRIAAIVTALVLFTDPYYVHYSIIIHPDSMQFAFALLALAASVRHLYAGDLRSLAAIGLLAGVVQGAKMGGPWLVPMAAVALSVGLWRSQPAWRAGSFFVQLLRRAILLGGAALLAYFVSSPQLFLKLELLAFVKSAWVVVSESKLTQVTYVEWFSDLWKHFGGLILVSAGAGLACAVFEMFSRRKPWPLFLAAILGLSQLVWYGFFGKLWVELGYMLCLFMVIGLFLGYLLTLVVRVLARGGLLGRAGASAAVAIALLLLVGGRWWNPASAALNYRLIDSKTVVEVGKWAEAGNIPRDARILWDDTAYFDPTKYPNARMRGDLLTYNELYAWRPDYIVLSSSIYEAKHYAELRKTQHYTMQNEGPFSVRLYQDLLSTSAPGWTKVPGIEFVRSFSENRDRKDDCSAPESGRYSPWLGDAAPAIAGEKITSIFGTAPLARWLSSRVATEIELLNHAGRLVDAIRGKVCVSSGSTLLVYRVHPPGTPNGFSRPLASSAAPDHPALAAFDGEKTTFWRPLREQRLGSFVGFDFGGGGERAVSRVQIDWPGMALAASEVTIEFADAEGEWRSAGQFPVKLARGAGEIVSSQHQLPADLGRHRLWRVVLSKIIGARQVAVAEARFLTPEEVASGAAKDIQGTIAPAVTLLDRAMQGEELVLSFDASTCQKRDLGTIQCGSEYRARYEPQSNRWTVTGYNKGEEGIVTRSADNADAQPGHISVWGMLNAFDAEGKLLHAGEKVGSIRLASTPSESMTGKSNEVASDRTSDPQATFVPVVTLLDKAMEGEELVLSFDPSTCQKRDLGTIQCGSEYRARYEPEKNRWTVTGYNKGEQGIVTRSAENADAVPGNISVWGMLNTFDADGKLFYLGQRAGSIRLANMPNERTTGQTAEGR